LCLKGFFTVKAKAPIGGHQFHKKKKDGGGEPGGGGGGPGGGASCFIFPGERVLRAKKPKPKKKKKGQKKRGGKKKKKKKREPGNDAGGIRAGLGILGFWGGGGCILGVSGFGFYLCFSEGGGQGGLAFHMIFRGGRDPLASRDTGGFGRHWDVLKGEGGLSNCRAKVPRGISFWGSAFLDRAGLPAGGRDLFGRGGGFVPL